MRKTNPGPTQTLLFPVADELLEAGHLALGIKTIIFATRTDIALILHDRAVSRRRRKLEKILAEMDDLEAAHCSALHNHND